MKNNCWLLNYKKNVYSQTGEDGIIKKVLEVIPENDKWCVEFGAWDGKHLTNTRHLIENGYMAVLIEADSSRYQNLNELYRNKDGVYTVNAFVGWKNTDSLDTILSKIDIPANFDLLSIDIDGNDYHVWDAIKKYSPKVVVIEFNPTIPTPVRFIQEANANVNQGSSLLSLVELGKSKGYELVCVLPFNAIFVKSEYFDIFGIEDNSPETLRVYTNRITYIFSGYDGRIILTGYKKLHWHGISLDEDKIQVLPKNLRKYPDNYTARERLAFKRFKNKK